MAGHESRAACPALCVFAQVAPAAQIAAKLRALKVTTGLEGEAAVALMTPHMMGGM